MDEYYSKEIKLDGEVAYFDGQFLPETDNLSPENDLAEYPALQDMLIGDGS